MALRETSAERLLAPTPSIRRPSWAAIVAGTVVGLLLLAGSVMWLHYGTAVFFEMVAAGIAACF